MGGGMQDYVSLKSNKSCRLMGELKFVLEIILNFCDYHLAGILLTDVNISELRL